jgi:hypothetical protein
MAGRLRPAATPTVDIAALMPRFTVTTASGETYGGLTYRGAMAQRARTGGTLSIEGREP